MGVIIAITSLVLAALSLVLFWRTNQRVQSALGGTSGDLTAALGSYHKQVKSVDQRLDQLLKVHDDLKLQLALASQKIAIVRFNPFGDTGGDQSFALAVLDENNSGYVLTSIHSRTGTRVYVKPVDFGKSKYNLSAEEEKALQLATKRTAKKETK